MSDKILISEVGLSETIKCTICKNPNKTERGCDGSCQYDKELHAKIVEAVTGIAERRTHGEWIEHKWAEEFDGHLISNYECSCCHSWKRENTDFCPNCGSDNRPKIHGCSFADEECKNNPCKDCGLKEG